MLDPMTRTEAVRWMELQLGSGVVVVEMTSEQLRTAFDGAIRWYVSRRGFRRSIVIDLTSGISEYPMPPDCDHVLEVAFQAPKPDIVGAINPYAFTDMESVPVAWASISGVPGGQFYSMYSLVLRHSETAKRVLGAEFAWEYDAWNRVLKLYPAVRLSGKAAVLYISRTLNAEDPQQPTDPPNDFRALPYRDRDIILRYALASAKSILGRIRGKYTDGLPSAGGSKTLDGDQLLSEAQAEFETLNEEVKALSEPVGFLVG